MSRLIALLSFLIALLSSLAEVWTLMLAWSASSSMTRIGQLKALSPAPSIQSLSASSRRRFFLTTARNLMSGLASCAAFFVSSKSFSSVVRRLQRDSVVCMSWSSSRFWVCRRRLSIVPVRTMMSRKPASAALAITDMKFVVFPLWT